MRRAADPSLGAVPGLRSDVPALLALADLYVHPSLQEGYSNAAARGDGGRQGSRRDRGGRKRRGDVRRRDGAARAAPQDAAALEAAIARLLAEPGAARAMGERAPVVRSTYDVGDGARGPGGYERLLSSCTGSVCGQAVGSASAAERRSCRVRRSRRRQEGLTDVRHRWADELRVGGAGLHGAARGMCDLIAHRGPDGSDTWARGSCRARPPAPGHHRSRATPGAQPMSTADGRDLAHVQRRDLQLPRAATELASARPPLPQPHRQRGHPLRLPRVRRRLPAASARHVRVRDLGRATDAACCSRATASARSRSSTGPTPTAWRSPPSRRPSSPIRASPATADPAALSAYLTYQYVPSPMSAFAGVRKLPPAHYLLVEDGRVSMHRYWKLSLREQAHDQTRARQSRSSARACARRSSFA